MWLLERLPPSGHAAVSDQLAVASGEDRLALDDAALDATRDGDDLTHAPRASAVECRVDDEVDRGGDRGHDEPGTDVLAGQQRKGAHLDEGLSGRVGVAVGATMPGKPALRARRRSRHSAERTSPMMRRDGRMRSASSAPAFPPSPPRSPPDDVVE